ncbi:hypothetical protein R69746_08669 [Paraburkholderia aspalathi]|nr:hypothetical protein R69746_08669 [Paraburkholderia aspalathi]
MSQLHFVGRLTLIKGILPGTAKRRNQTWQRHSGTCQNWAVSWNPNVTRAVLKVAGLYNGVPANTS